MLGDRYGTSCVGAVAETVEATLRGLGYERLPQQALCRRLHHRALRQSGRRPARHPARDQPRALHGRAALRALGRISRAWRADFDTLARRLGEIPLEELRPYRAAAE